MATYSVTVPIAGHAVVEVEADSKAEAIDKATNRPTGERGAKVERGPQG